MKKTGVAALHCAMLAGFVFALGGSAQAAQKFYLKPGFTKSGTFKGGNHDKSPAGGGGTTSGGQSSNSSSSGGSSGNSGGIKRCQSGKRC